MDIFKGEKLILRCDVVHTTKDMPFESLPIKYPKGTAVEVTSLLEPNVILVKFPGGEEDPVSKMDLWNLFDKEDGSVLTRTIRGVGTPPKAFYPAMPEEAKWDFNYGWSITMTLNQLSRKEAICKDCYSELIPTSDQKEEGIMCPQCQSLKTPVAISSILLN